MSDTLERLRRLHGLREQKREEHSTPRDGNTAGEPATVPAAEVPAAEVPAAEPADRGPQALAIAVPGTELENDAGTCYVATYAFPLENPRGDFPLGALLEQPPRILDQLTPVGIRSRERDGLHFDYSHAAFIDTETSGLGTGSCCFMVGVGSFETLTTFTGNTSASQNATRPHSDDGIALSATLPAHSLTKPALAAPDAATHFVVRQLFMRHPGEETALLVALAQVLNPFAMTVTFNGRSFDLPLLRSRFRLHRHFLPASAPAPQLLDEHNIHVDLLPPARRLWKRRLQSCRLINLEQKILQLHRSEDDVPGHLIPMLYVNYTRNGDARAMRQVFYHNREDIVSMVGIATHLIHTIRNTQPAREASGRTAPTPPRDHTDGGKPAQAALHGHEWLAMGQHYARQGRHEDAIAALHNATQMLTNTGDRALAFSELATLYKRAGDWTQACATWQLWISSVPGADPTPYLELAKYCEWQSRELSQAEMWSAWALHNLNQAVPRSPHRDHIPEIEHRLARIRRKRAAQAARTA